MRQPPPRMQDQLYHDMILPEETLHIRAKARDFAVRVVFPRATEIAHTEESRDSFPWDVFRKMAEEDLFKIPFPADAGGMGLHYPCCATVVTVEELAYFSNSIAAVYDVHCIMACHALENGSGVIKFWEAVSGLERWKPGL